MARFIHSPRLNNNRYPATSDDMLRLFGIEGSKWPKEGCPLRFIQGIAVHVLPSDHLSLVRHDGRKSSKHRCIAACPDCGIAVPVSRLQQHKCKTKHKRGARKIDRAFQTAELSVARAKAVPPLDLRDLARAYHEAPPDTQDEDDAHNAFCEEAGNRMSRTQRAEWDRWCLKATSDEIVSEALRILGLQPVERAFGLTEQSISES